MANGRKHASVGSPYTRTAPRYRFRLVTRQNRKENYMKHSIRRGVFETNSSSMHTLVFSSKPAKLDVEMKNGYAIAHPTYYDSERYQLITPQEKLDYLIAYALCKDQGFGYFEEQDVREFTDDNFLFSITEKEDEEENFKIFLGVQNALIDKFGIKGIKVDVEGEIGFDHQTVPGRGDNPLDQFIEYAYFTWMYHDDRQRLTNPDFVCWFLTSDDVAIQTERD